MTKQTSSSQFESQVSKTRKNTSSSLEDVDSVGKDVEKIHRRSEAGLRDTQKWDSASSRDPPKDEYESLLEFAQESSNRIEAMDRDIERLNEIEEEANNESYRSLMNITDGNNAQRALESDERVVDKLRHQALEVSQDETVADNIQESVSKNIDSLEEEIEEISTVLNSSLSSYAEDFEDYMEEMASFARDEYGAMAQMTDYLSELEDMDIESELGEATVNYLQEDIASSLESQTRKISEIHNEMLKATESTKRLEEGIETDVRDRYDINQERLKDSIDYAETILGNMAGDYETFTDRAEAMIAENTGEVDVFDLSAVEKWGSEATGEVAR
jgi:hypothetical protein